MAGWQQMLAKQYNLTCIHLHGVRLCACVYVMLRVAAPVAVLHHAPESAVGKETRNTERDESKSTASGKSKTKWGINGKQVRGDKLKVQIRAVGQGGSREEKG